MFPSSTGAPLAIGEGRQASPANLSPGRPANDSETSYPPSPRTCITKPWDDRTACSVLDRWSAHTSSNGGSAEIAENALQVKPCGTPSAPTVVTTATAVGNEPNKSRKVALLTVTPDHRFRPGQFQVGQVSGWPLEPRWNHARF